MDAESPENLEKRKTFVGPWENVAEFHRVYHWLFGKNASNDTKRQALGEMHIWKLRRGTMCPAAVLATSAILRVQLKDSDAQLAKTDLEDLYAFALIRFFNFMSSTMQSHQHRTMYDTARELGLQSFVVDLRHICSHSAFLPELSMLRSTSKYCLEWLLDYYWRPGYDSMTDVDSRDIRRKDKTELGDKVSDLIEVYDTAMECHMKGANNLKTARRLVHGVRFSIMKEFYATRKLQSLEECLNEATKELGFIARCETDVKNVQEVFIRALMRMKYFYCVANTKSLEKLLEASKGLFRLLAVNGLVEDYFYALFEMAENSLVNSKGQAGCSFWASLIIEGFIAFRKCKQMCKAELDQNPNFKEIDFTVLNSKNMTKDVRKILIYSRIDLKRTLLFGDSFRRPWVWVFDRCFLEKRLENINENTGPTIKSLLELIEPPLTITEVEAIHKLIDTRFGSATNDTAQSSTETVETETNDKTYTALDLLQFLDETPDLDPNNVVQNNNTFGIWSYDHDDAMQDWSTCPLGKLPWH